MELKTTIFNSELELRNYIVLNSTRISQIIVVEDILDNTIFFYCFIESSELAAAKETSKDFSYYKKIYRQLAVELYLQVEPNRYQINVLTAIR